MITLPSPRIAGIALGAIGIATISVLLLIARADAAHWQKVAKASEALREADRATWREATRKATYDAVFNVTRVQMERAAITERTIHALALDRDRAAAGLDRLRQSAAAHRSAPGHPDLSAEREATCRAYAAAGCDEIPALLKAAQDNTDQLLRWIEWGAAQGAVQTVAPTPATASAP